MKEIKRKAKVGEKIKIVDTDDSRYKVGDIFTVKMVGDDFVYAIPPEKEYVVLDKEYVVLEDEDNCFKVGDKVLLKNRRGAGWNDEGKMDHYMGQVVTISCIDGGIFEIEEDDRGNTIHWAFGFDDIERKENEFQIKDLQFADILTLKNGERYVVTDGYMNGESSDYYCDEDEIEEEYNEDLTRKNKRKEHDIMKVERAGQAIFERKEVVEMTISEISKKLGYEVKIIKEKD